MKKIVALAIVVIAVGAIIAPRIIDFLRVDSCLDSGGRWSAEIKQCYSSLAMTADDTKAMRVVESYVAEVHKWPTDSYRIELNYREGNVLTFWVIHRDDEVRSKWQSSVGGGGKSFSVDVDAKTLRVIRELAFQ